MKFTIIIPTFKRADMLRIALQSVNSQTAKHLIGKVIVSENGLNRESEYICQEFLDLPIKYVYQHQQLAVQKHMQWLMMQEEENYVALLCDDDWWDIHHLAMAAEEFAKNSNCVAYFSNFVYAQTQYSLKKQTHHSGVEALHFKNSNFSNYQPTVYTKENIFLFSLLITPFHFSSMVCMGKVLVKSVVKYDEFHPTYADRLLYPVISTFGDIIFNPLKTAIILYHQSMDSHNYDAEEWKRERQKGSLKLMEIAKESNVNVADILNEVYSSSDGDDSLFIVQEVKHTFPNRKNLDWFIGLDKILADDAVQMVPVVQNTLRIRIIAKFSNILKRIF